jgi:tetratricopeptide (TPR) repeat protein
LREITAARLALLEAQVAADPDAPCFGALAELYRRAGRLSEAERVLRAGLRGRPTSLEARALLALVLSDQGRSAEAHGELERIAATLLDTQGLAARPVEASALSDAELDQAFDQAQTDAEQLIDPNRVAQEAILHADSGAGEGLREDGVEGPLGPGQAFVTETMARLLDRQGDARGAARIRAALAAESPPRRDQRLARAQRRTRTVAVLERWLANLRRDWV